MPCNTTVIGRGPTARDANTTTPGASAVADKSTLALAPKPSPLTTATRASSAPEPLATTSKQTAALAQNQRARDRSIASLLGRSRTKKRHASQRAFTPVVNSLRNAASETHRASEEKCDHRPLDHGKRAPLNLFGATASRGRRDHSHFANPVRTRTTMSSHETIPVSQIPFELEPLSRATRALRTRVSNATRFASFVTTSGTASLCHSLAANDESAEFVSDCQRVAVAPIAQSKLALVVDTPDLIGRSDVTVAR